MDREIAAFYQENRVDIVRMSRQDNLNGRVARQFIKYVRGDNHDSRTS